MLILKRGLLNCCFELRGLGGGEWGGDRGRKGGRIGEERGRGVTAARDRRLMALESDPAAHIQIISFFSKFFRTHERV